MHGGCPHAPRSNLTTSPPVDGRRGGPLWTYGGPPVQHTAGGVGGAPYAARMRPDASVLHLDLDAFFAAVEQRDKPSLRGKPVVVGGVGGRGVVATASYEARKYGVRSAMSTREARSRCPHAAFLSGRFHAYREASERVMETLRAVSPLVEPLSLDEAFVDLARADLPDLSVPTVTAGRRGAARRGRRGDRRADRLGRHRVLEVHRQGRQRAGQARRAGRGLPGTERDLLRPMHVTVIPGVGPATAERLRRAGIHTVADLETVSEDELVRLLGNAHGHGLYLLARAEDDRPVVAERETKSVSVEGTYDTDLTDRRLMEGLLTRQADDGRQAAARARACPGARSPSSCASTTSPRSAGRRPCPSPTDHGATIARLAREPARRRRHLRRRAAARRRRLRPRRLGAGGPVRRRPRSDDRAGGRGPRPADGARAHLGAGRGRRARELGPGWVWGSGRGVVTVRFETAREPAGPGALVRRRRPRRSARHRSGDRRPRRTRPAADVTST